MGKNARYILTVDVDFYAKDFNLWTEAMVHKMYC